MEDRIEEDPDSHDEQEEAVVQDVDELEALEGGVEEFSAAEPKLCLVDYAPSQLAETFKSFVMSYVLEPLLKIVNYNTLENA